MIIDKYYQLLIDTAATLLDISQYYYITIIIQKVVKTAVGLLSLSSSYRPSHQQTQS
jgi:hypothetical protein